MQNLDERICSLLKTKDEKGMELLFGEYYKALVLWATTFLNDVSRSEDVVQDFFIKIWEREFITTLEAKTLKSYLYTSIRNLSINQVEKKDFLKHTCDVARLDQPWEEYNHFEDEVLKRVEMEIERLPSRSREIIQCVYLRGMRYKEVADELGISVATVNTLLVNALRHLRERGGSISKILISLYYIFCQKRSNLSFPKEKLIFCPKNT